MPFQNWNPNYFQHQQQYNPFMQRMDQLQQFQQNLQQSIATPQIPGAPLAPLGKVVESADIVKVTDIPMDGNAYYFPKADGAEIYVKQFMPNGQTRILTFKPILEDDPNNNPMEAEKIKFEDFNNVLMGIQSDIKTLNDKIDKIGKTNKGKKEMSEDE